MPGEFLGLGRPYGPSQDQVAFCLLKDEWVPTGYPTVRPMKARSLVNRPGIIPGIMQLPAVRTYLRACRRSLVAPGGTLL